MISEMWAAGQTWAVLPFSMNLCPQGQVQISEPVTSWRCDLGNHGVTSLPPFPHLANGGSDGLALPRV